MESHPASLKVYFIPSVFTSHLFNLFELCRCLAARGVHVIFFSTPSTTDLLNKSLLKAEAAGHRIHVHNLKFPSQEVGLPEGVENLVGVDDLGAIAKVGEGMGLLRGQMEQFMEQNPPDCIVADMFHPWTSDFANQLGIPRLIFDANGVFPACCQQSIRRLPNFPHLVNSNPDPFILPGLPHPITLTFSRLPEFIQNTTPLTHFMELVNDAESKCYGRIINGFAELEEEYIEHYKKTTGKTVWHLGPTSLMNNSSEDKAARNVKAAVSEDEILSWLNSKQPNSVLYICFGSAAHFAYEQLLELSSALESSAHNFVWVVDKKQRTEHETEESRQKWMPRGFEERMKREGRGMVIRGWAPQTLILEHVAVGGFITQCGWNSMLEAISSGVPMITWPLHSEQFFIEQLILRALGIGVELGADDCGALNVLMGLVKKSLLKRHRIESAIRKLMGGGDEAMEMRRRVKELAEKAKAAVREGGSSQRNLTALIQDLQEMKSARTEAQIDNINKRRGINY